MAKGAAFLAKGAGNISTKVAGSCRPLAIIKSAVKKAEDLPVCPKGQLLDALKNRIE